MHVLTFTDLIYAALAAYSISAFDIEASQRHWLAVAYLLVSVIWMFYDWYANHFFAIQEHMGAKNIPLDMVSFAQYAGLLFYSKYESPVIYIFLAIRGLRGIVYNEVALRQWHGVRDAERLRSYNYSSGFMVVAYSALYVIDRTFGWPTVGPRLVVAVLVWVIAYGLALLAENRFVRRLERSTVQGQGRQIEDDHSMDRDRGRRPSPIVFGLVILWVIWWRVRNDSRQRGSRY